MSGGGKNDNENNPPLSLAAAVALSESEPEIPSGLGGKEAAATAAGYAELEFTIFTRFYILVFVLIHWYLY